MKENTYTFDIVMFHVSTETNLGVVAICELILTPNVKEIYSLAESLLKSNITPCLTITALYRIYVSSYRNDLYQ